jgi:predicted choloylglycine hydrolase
MNLITLLGILLLAWLDKKDRYVNTFSSWKYVIFVEQNGCTVKYKLYFKAQFKPQIYSDIQGLHFLFDIVLTTALT